jgi:hypothetical protein
VLQNLSQHIAENIRQQRRFYIADLITLVVPIEKSYHCTNVCPSSKRKTMRLYHSYYGSISKQFACSALEQVGPKNGMKQKTKIKAISK